MSKQTTKPDRIWLIYDHRGGNLNGFKVVTEQRDQASQPFADFIEIIGEYQLVQEKGIFKPL